MNEADKESVAKYERQRDREILKIDQEKLIKKYLTFLAEHYDIYPYKNQQIPFDNVQFLKGDFGSGPYTKATHYQKLPASYFNQNAEKFNLLLTYIEKLHK